MTTSAETIAPPSKAAPIWDDIPDIFFEPVAVFDRRRDGRFGKMLLLLLLVMSVLGAASTWALAPAQAADSSRMMARVAQGNPEVAAQVSAAAARERTVLSAVFGGVGTAVMIAVSIFLVGLAAWLLGILFGSKATLPAGVMIATYAFFPRMLAQVAMILQGLLMDQSSLDSMFRVTASPARFLDPDTTSFITMLLLSRLDVFVLWSTILVGIGIYVVGRISKAEAAAVAVLVWAVGSLPALVPVMLFS